MTLRKKRIPNALFIKTDSIIHTKIKPPQKITQIGIKRLCDSIERYGMINPITVRECGNVYELICGEKRLSAARILGLEYVPCIVITAPKKACAGISVSENSVRSERSFFDESDSVMCLINSFKMSLDEISRLYMKTPSEIQNYIRISKFGHDERFLILENGLDFEYAVTLIKLSDKYTRRNALKSVILEGMDIEKTKVLVNRLLENADCGFSIPCRNRGMEKLVIKDLRLFENSVDRAISNVKKAGIDIGIEKTDTADSVVYRIVIDKQKLIA